MRKISIYIFAALCALSLTGCTKDGAVEMQERQLVDVCLDLGVDSVSGLMEEPRTKLTNPMDPQYENQIIDLWVLQYSHRINSDGVEVGDLIHKYHQALPIAMTAVSSFNVPLYTGESRLVVFANTNNADMSLFPNDMTFPATLTQLRKHIFADDQMIDFPDDKIKFVRMMMCGSEIVNVTQGTPALTHVSMFLSRLNCKLRVALRLKEGSAALTDVKLQLCNAAKGFGAFQVEDMYQGAEHRGTYQEITIGDLTTARKYEYFYTGENIVSSFDESHPETGTATYLKITASKSGSPVVRYVPITPYGSIYRNTFYNIDLTLSAD